MRYIYEFDKELQIASVREDIENGIGVLTLLQNVNQKQPSINAYLGARYSRSADSVKTIAQEIMQKGIDASSRLESIFSGYGHKSVGDMAELFVCIENVPMILAMRAFYLNPTLAGQERSTRFQNFKQPNFVDMPEGINEELVSEYYSILNSYLVKYEELLEKITDAYASYYNIDVEDKQQLSALNARVFDTVRYLIPLGMRTSLGFIMSARNWSEYISRLLGSRYSQENRLGTLLLDILSKSDTLMELGYIPEADGLIRHTDANTTRYETTKEMREYLKGKIPEKILDNNAEYTGIPDNDLKVDENDDPVYELLCNYLLSINPNIKLGDHLDKYFDDENILKDIGQILSNRHNHHNQIGNIAQTGAYSITGYADHGILKDLNRHRSFERFVPLWEDSTDLEIELKRDNPYSLCNYLYIDEFKELKQYFTSFLDDTYLRIKDWNMRATREVGIDFSNEYTKYLLPHAHSTRYRYFASIDDLLYTINLRIRPGGHIAYRSLVKSWANHLAKESIFFKGLFSNLSRVDPNSSKEFLDRG